MLSRFAPPSNVIYWISWHQSMNIRHNHWCFRYPSTSSIIDLSVLNHELLAHFLSASAFFRLSNRIKDFWSDFSHSILTTSYNSPVSILHLMCRFFLCIRFGEFDRQKRLVLKISVQFFIFVFYRNGTHNSITFRSSQFYSILFDASRKRPRKRHFWRGNGRKQPKKNREYEISKHEFRIANGNLLVKCIEWKPTRN